MIAYTISCVVWSKWSESLFTMFYIGCCCSRNTIHMVVEVITFHHASCAVSALYIWHRVIITFFSNFLRKTSKIIISARPISSEFDAVAKVKSLKFRNLIRARSVIPIGWFISRTSNTLSNKRRRIKKTTRENPTWYLCSTRGKTK